MNEAQFRAFLDKGGRSKSAADRCVALVRDFAVYLEEHQHGMDLRKAGAEELVGFVEWVEVQPNQSAKGHLWALGYYFDFISSEPLRTLAITLRQQRIKRKPFLIRKFLGVKPVYVDELAGVGIKTVEQVLEAGSTQEKRQELSEKTGLPLEAILEFVKLSDLARVRGLKNIRARLYYDAGVDTVKKLAGWDPEALRAMLIEYVEEAEFPGIAPLQGEVKDAVSQARKLPEIVTY